MRFFKRCNRIKVTVEIPSTIWPDDYTAEYSVTVELPEGTPVTDEIVNKVYEDLAKKTLRVS